MIKAEKLSYEFPDKTLYKDISFTIEEGSHCVLIGSNGSGKTTLAEILMHPDDFLFDGKLMMENKGNTGYVNQFYQREKEREITVFEYLSEDFVKMQNRLTEICEEMAQEDAPDNIFDIYQQQLDEIEAVDGDNYESNIKKRLKESSLLFLENKLLSSLSGGEYKLLQIMKAMLKCPKLLIMDEPDVFLDFDNLYHLRHLINTYQGTLLVITHNRYLLNFCFDKILHLEGEDIQEFEGRFPEYRLALFLKKIQLLEEAESCQQEIERTEKMVERMRNEATKAAIASLGRTLNAKQTYLDRLRERAIKPPFVNIQRPEIHFPDVMDVGEEILLRTEDYTLAFDCLLLDHINFCLKEGEKVAVVGANGTGKSTFLKEVFTGENQKIHYAQGCKTAFLSQVQKEIEDGDNTVYDVLSRAGLEKEEDMRSLLKKYCLQEETLYKKVKLLSGGEKNILQLLKISLSDANLLLLDEPTSHLDTFAQIELEEAIAEYKGAVLMVSHDFYNIVNCADYVFLVENNSFRQMRMRSFRKRMYESYFSVEYIQQEEKRKELETRISENLKNGKIEKAKELCEQLAALLQESGNGK